MPTAGLALGDGERQSRQWSQARKQDNRIAGDPAVTAQSTSARTMKLTIIPVIFNCLLSQCPPVALMFEAPREPKLLTIH